jgi:hypothetical protein
MPWPKGRPRSPEERAKISASLKGPKSPRWVGDAVGYNGVHARIARSKVRTGRCERCGVDAGFGRAGTDFANISGEYRDDIDDYVELCKSCHRNHPPMS